MGPPSEKDVNTDSATLSSLLQSSAIEFAESNHMVAELVWVSNNSINYARKRRTPNGLRYAPAAGYHKRCLLEL